MPSHRPIIIYNTHIHSPYNVLVQTFPIFSDYSKVVTFPECGTRHCVTLSIENDLRVTSTEVVDISLDSTDERIALAQSNGTTVIDRPGMLVII